MNPSCRLYVLFLFMADPTVSLSESTSIVKSRGHAIGSWFIDPSK